MRGDIFDLVINSGTYGIDFRRKREANDAFSL